MLCLRTGAILKVSCRSQIINKHKIKRNGNNDSTSNDIDDRSMTDIDPQLRPLQLLSQPLSLVEVGQSHFQPAHGEEDVCFLEQGLFLGGCWLEGIRSLGGFERFWQNKCSFVSFLVFIGSFRGFGKF